MENKKLITIFTPTFNRDYTIERLYESLKNQKSKNFEWIVIDDGSIDNTKNIFLDILSKKNDFEIIYYFQKNGGKHRAINKGIDLSNSELFFIVDSDDYLIENATKEIENWYRTINEKEKINFAGIAGAKGYSKEKYVGTIFNTDKEFIDCTSLERKKNGIKGDKAEIFFTNILKKFKFPEIEGENFLTEGIVWNRIASKNLKIRWFKKIIYICDYLEDGLTKSGREIFKKNPKGYLLYIQELKKYKNVSIRKKYGIQMLYYKDFKESFNDKEIKSKLGINCLQFLIIKILEKFYS